MLRCWQENPNDRPTFGQLVTDINQMIAKIEHSTGAQSRNIDQTYVNVDMCNHYHYRDDVPGMGGSKAKAEKSPVAESSPAKLPG